MKKFPFKIPILVHCMVLILLKSKKCALTLLRGPSILMKKFSKLSFKLSITYTKSFFSAIHFFYGSCPENCFLSMKLLSNLGRYLPLSYVMVWYWMNQEMYVRSFRVPNPAFSRSMSITTSYWSVNGIVVGTLRTLFSNFVKYAKRLLELLQ